MSNDNKKTLANLKKARDAKASEPKAAILPEFAHLDEAGAALLSSFHRGLVEAVRKGNEDPENNDTGGMDDGGL